MNGRIARILLLLGLAVLFSSTLLAQGRWIYQYPNMNDVPAEAMSVVMGLDGNIYASGSTEQDVIQLDFTVISLTASGAERWIYPYRGSGGGFGMALSITVGADSNLYVAGASDGDPLYGVFTVVSLTHSGVERWVYLYDAPANEYDQARSIVVGSDGNVYAAGASQGTGAFYDFTVVSLDTSGGERWIYRYDGPAGVNDEAYSIVGGWGSNLYVAGYSVWGGGSGEDFTVVSLDTSGVERWVYRYDGPGSDLDVAQSIVFGLDGNLYAAGYSSGVGTYGDFTVVSLDTSGTERWIYRYEGPGSYLDAAHSIVFGLDGNLYAAGRSYGIGTYDDLTVVSLDTSGIERWVYRYDGPGGGMDIATSLAVGSDGNLYAAGWSDGSGAYDDFTVVSLTDSGIERWVFRYHGPGDSYNGANSIIAGPDSSLCVAGYTSDAIGHWPIGRFTVASLTHSGSVNAAVTRIDLPPDTVFVDSTYGVRCIVSNLASITVTSDVVARIDGYIDTVQVQDLKPGASVQVDFQDWQVPSADSTVYGMTVCVRAAGDIDTMNDCRQKTIFAYDPTGIQEEHDRTVVMDFRLWENYPNPFHYTTLLSYSLPQTSEVTLSIYDITGRLVETLVNETQQPGIHQVRWNRRTNPSGVYFYRLKAREFISTKKMVVVE